MLRDALAWLKEQIDKGQESKIQPVPGLDCILINGETVGTPLPVRNHQCDSVDSLCHAIEYLSHEEEPAVIWIGEGSVFAVLDDSERRRNIITMPLIPSRAFKIITGLVRKASDWSHSELAQELDKLVPQHLAPTAFNALATIKTIRLQSTQNGKSSMDREIESAAAQELAEKLPRSIHFGQVPAFSINHGIEPYSIKLECRADAESGTFRFHDIGHEIESFSMKARKALREVLQEILSAEEALVFIGTP